MKKEYWKPTYKPLSSEERLERSRLRKEGLDELKFQAKNSELPHLITWDYFKDIVENNESSISQLHQPVSISAKTTEAPKKTSPSLRSVLGSLFFLLVAYIAPKDGDYYQYQLDSLAGISQQDMDHESWIRNLKYSPPNTQIINKLNQADQDIRQSLIDHIANNYSEFIPNITKDLQANKRFILLNEHPQHYQDINSQLGSLKQAGLSFIAIPISIDKSPDLQKLKEAIASGDKDVIKQSFRVSSQVDLAIKASELGIKVIPIQYNKVEYLRNSFSIDNMDYELKDFREEGVFNKIPEKGQGIIFYPYKIDLQPEHQQLTKIKSTLTNWLLKEFGQDSVSRYFTVDASHYFQYVLFNLKPEDRNDLLYYHLFDSAPKNPLVVPVANSPLETIAHIPADKIIIVK